MLLQKTLYCFQYFLSRISLTLNNQTSRFLSLDNKIEFIINILHAMIFKSLQEDFREAFKEALRNGFDDVFEDEYEDTLKNDFRNAFRDALSGDFERSFERDFGEGVEISHQPLRRRSPLEPPSSQDFGLAFLEKAQQDLPGTDCSAEILG